MTREEAHLKADDKELSYVDFHIMHQDIEDKYDKKEGKVSNSNIQYIDYRNL